MKPNKRLVVTLAAAVSAGSLLLAPTPAQACGGFFCSQVPVEQTGEQILFGMDGGKISAQILINYAGEAEDFAWLLPVASKPEITLGSAAAFTNLGFRTAPSWRLEWTAGAQCNWWSLYPQLAEADNGTGGVRDGDEVSVLAKKEVGPFETVVLESSSTDDLIAWLNDNDYAQPPGARALIDHYVKQDMVFVALRLLKDEPTGAIQPITLTFEEANPCVPLVLTQVAATPDMPVQLYLVSDHRVVPNNWLHVVLNQKKIDWLNGGSNYTDVVTQAVDEASGRGFVTEFAGSSALLDDLVYREGQFDLAKLAAATTPEGFVMELLSQGFARDAQMQGLLRKHIPMPAAVATRGIDEQSFYNDLASYALDLAAAGFVFDALAFVADIDERVVTPMRDTQAVFDSKPYFTRLFTTVSADEMTRDPVFSQNPDLADVSNLHIAKATPTCGSDPSQPPESVLIEFDDGETMTLTGPFQQTFTGSGPEINYPDPAPGEPAALRIELIGATGQATLVHPWQVIAVDIALDTQTPSQVLIDLANGSIAPTPVPDNQLSASGGCSQGELLGGLAGGISALALLFRKKR